MRTLLTAALVAGLPLASAGAEIITVKYEATLDVQLPAGWPEGVVLSGIYTFDSEATPQVVGHTATYPLLRHSITLNGTLFVGNMNELTITDNEQSSTLLFLRTTILPCPTPQEASTVLRSSDLVLEWRAFMAVTAH